MAKMVRVRPAAEGGPCAVRHPDHGEYVVPNPAQAYRSDDPLVRAFPWLFVADNDVEPEMATRAPGERRALRRAQ